MLFDPRVCEREIQRPINEAALEWLKQVKAAEDPSSGLHVLTLALWGLEQGVAVPLLHRAERGNLELGVGMLCGRPSDQVMRWLVSNPEGEEDPKLQEADLLSWIEGAETAEEAAMRVLETIADHLRHENAL